MGIVLNFPMDEGSGTTLYDRSGNNNNGTIYGASFVSGKFDKALSFDGIDDYARVNNVSVGQSITVLVWAKSSTSLWNTYGWIASSRVANGFIIHANQDSKAWSGYIVDSAGNNYWIGTHIPDDITQWHQYGVMYDYTSQKGYLIFDGQIVVTQSTSMTRTSGNINIEFGRDYEITTRYGNGLVDEVLVYNQVLSAEEIKRIYNAYNFFRFIHIKGITENDFTKYVIDFTIEKELEKMLDKLTLQVSRAIDSETWFNDFNPDIEILIWYQGNKVFRGRCKNREKKETYKVEVFSSGEVLSRKVANKIYDNQSPEAIFSNLITYYTDLTPVVASSGYTMKRFIANDYLDAIALKLAQTLEWQIRVDANKNIYFEPRGYTTNPNVIYRTPTGANARFGEWEKDQKDLCNYVVISGSEQEYQTEQYFSGNGTQVEYTLYEVPKEIRVLLYISGSWQEQSRTAYSVKPEDKKIVFNTAPPSGTNNIWVIYTYSYPVYVEKKNSDSIASYGTFMKKLHLPFLKSIDDARAYAMDYLSLYAQPLMKNKIVVPMAWINKVNIGDKIRIDDDLDNIDNYFTVQKMKVQYIKGSIELYCGQYIPQLSLLHLYIQDRIKELEKSLTTATLQLFGNEQETITLSETFNETSTNYINKKLATYIPKVGYSRGSLYDARVGLCRCG